LVDFLLPKLEQVQFALCEFMQKKAGANRWWETAVW